MKNSRPARIQYRLQTANAERRFDAARLTFVVWLSRVFQCPPRPAIAAAVVFLVTWLIYGQAIPFVMATWKITGDEPHYLLAAHSLARDGDLDLKNNYLDGDHREFYSFGFLDPHVKEQPDGAWLLAHDIGLPVVMVPAYAVGGRLGVMRFFAFAGALLASQMFLLGWEVSGKMWAGLLGWLSMSFSAPLSLYVFQVYPEMLGGLLVLWSARRILNTPSWPNEGGDSGGAAIPIFRFSLVIASLAVLPWLSGRNIPIVLILIVLLVWKHWPRRALWLSGCANASASLVVYLAVNFALYGGPTPSATSAGSAVGAGFSNVAGQQIGRGLAAWLFDQQRGLLVYGPVLIVALFGLPHLWRLRKREGLLLLAPFAAMWLLASVWGGFYIGWEISARFLIVGIPPMAAGIASAAARVRRVFFWPLAAALLTLSILNTAIVILDPFYAYHESPIKFYEEATRWQIRPYLPALGTRTIEAPPGGAAEWTAPAGGATYLLRATVDELSIGWYKLYAQAQLAGAAPDAVALTFDIFSSEAGIPLAHGDARPADADPATGVVNIGLPFYNPYYDKWNFPLYVDVRATGAADVRLSWLLFEPDPAQSYWRAAVWAGGIALLTALFAYKNTVER